MNDDTRLRFVEQYRLAVGIPDARCADKSNTELASKIVGFALDAFRREIESESDLKPWPDADWKESYDTLSRMAREFDKRLKLPVIEQVAIVVGVPAEDLKQGLSRCPHSVAAVLGYDNRSSQLEPDKDRVLGEESAPAELDDAGVLEHVAGVVRKLSSDLDRIPAGLQHIAWGVLATMARHRSDYAKNIEIRSEYGKDIHVVQCR